MQLIAIDTFLMYRKSRNRKKSFAADKKIYFCKMVIENGNLESGQVFEDKDRTKDVITGETVEFKDLHLSPNILSGLTKSNFIRPSPIQLKSIPYGRCGLDLIVQAKSGTGKTCVFTVVALESIVLEKNTLQAIILAPTREIAIQISDVIKAIGQDMKSLSVGIFIGGFSVSDDIKNCENCQIAVGSPGRIKQLIELEALSCRNVRLFVIDEADKLLSDNFQEQINWIYSSLPANKQMIAASATYPEELATFLQCYMRTPTFIRLNPSDMALVGLKQYYVKIKQESAAYKNFERKITTVCKLLTSMQFKQVLVFSNYHAHAKSLCEACIAAGFPSTYISGGMEQTQRIKAINMLKKFECRVLISTDLTSRGIDSQNVDVVINMDTPHDWETYLHRIGRAGRFGARGVAITIVCEGEEFERLKTIEETCNMDITAYPGSVHLNKIDSLPEPAVPLKLESNVLGSSTPQRTTNRRVQKEEVTVAAEPIYLPSLRNVMQGVGLPPKLPFNFSRKQMKEDMEYFVEHKELKRWDSTVLKRMTLSSTTEEYKIKEFTQYNMPETLMVNENTLLQQDLNLNKDFEEKVNCAETTKDSMVRKISPDKNKNTKNKLKKHKKKIKSKKSNLETENKYSSFLLPRFSSRKEERKFFEESRKHYHEMMTQQAYYYKMCYKYWKQMANSDYS